MGEQQNDKPMTLSAQLRKIADQLECPNVEILNIHNALGHIYVVMTTKVLGIMAADLAKLNDPHRIVTGTSR